MKQYFFISLAPTQYDCDFEKDLCTWNQSPDDDFDWIRAQGPTGTAMTGPVVDHTIGNSKNFFFNVLSHTSCLTTPQEKRIVTSSHRQCRIFIFKLSFQDEV